MKLNDTDIEVLGKVLEAANVKIENLEKEVLQLRQSQSDQSLRDVDTEQLITDAVAYTNDVYHGPRDGKLKIAAQHGYVQGGQAYWNKAKSLLAANQKQNDAGN